MLGVDSLYGNLLGHEAAVSGPARPEVPKHAASAASDAARRDQAAGPPSPDDIFANSVAAAAAASPPADEEKQDETGKPVVMGPEPPPAVDKVAFKEPSTAQLPASFSAARLMMPAVRKKVEPPSAKRPSVPALDIQKLQQEKEALLRQRSTAAAERKEEVSRLASGAAKPAAGGTSTASNAAAGSAASGAGEMAEGLHADVGPGTAITRELLYGSPEEEYDPARPNDYDEFCRRRMRLKAEEEMERRRQEGIARREAAEKPPEAKEDDFATRMMKKMGWKEGSGLGKDGQGMQAPLVMKKTDKATGVIAEGQKREAAPAAAAPAQKQAKTADAAAANTPTRVLLLNNLVGAGEVDEDLESETAEEAGKYGALKRCVVREIKGVPDIEAVRIFLEFEKVEAATKAMIDMNGRYFGGRVVKARFFDEKRFEAGSLERD